ncbi:MAG: hypothetical protein K9K21_06095 [Desulfotignum sp.]|nr:hypothetical protein [Desulfotignum sp.]MCF8113407.1 hypothetical protein [Desulfotignum sp.]MCF8126196.1 hypothetical protein [Desulfotignum sp.]
MKQLDTEKKIVLTNMEYDELQRMQQILAQNNYVSHVADHMDSLINALSGHSTICAILDLDTLDVTNQVIRKLTIQYPHVCFLCTSQDRFHPELKDAICYHIYACLTKPLDYDELLYWLRCIENDVESPVSHK